MGACCPCVNDSSILLPSSLEDDRSIPLPPGLEDDSSILLPSSLEDDRSIHLPPGLEDDSSIPLPSSLEHYEPREDGSHLRLGITLEGFVEFLVMIGFIRKTNDGWKNETYPGQTGLNDYFEYTHHGEIGYQLCDFLRTFLKENGAEKLSVCEMILMHSQFAHLRKFVGCATVFWSHMQQEYLIGQKEYNGQGNRGWFGTMGIMMQALLDDLKDKDLATTFWIDYTSLRQCGKDFDLKRIMALIRQIGVVYSGANLLGGQINEYLGRSFCVFEIYAGVVGDAKVMTPVIWAEWMEDGGEIGQVRCENATARNESYQKTINDYIISTVGYEKVNRTITEAYLSNTYEKAHAHVYR